MTALSVAIRKEIGAFRLDAAFDAPPGITAIFGPSGSGKTLTLRCIAGLSRPEFGTVAVQGRALFDQAAAVDLSPQDRGVGYVFQQYALFPHMTVAANLAYGLHRLPGLERQRRVARLLELVGLDEYADRLPRELSGGQQQRVAMARALAPEPAVLLLDEPFVAVDGLVRGQLRRELRAIHDRLRTPMVLVTHDLAEVQQLADFMVLYLDGRVLQSGPPAEVIAAPHNGQAAALLEAAR